MCARNGALEGEESTAITRSIGGSEPARIRSNISTTRQGALLSGTGSHPSATRNEDTSAKSDIWSRRREDMRALLQSQRRLESRAQRAITNAACANTVGVLG